MCGYNIASIDRACSRLFELSDRMDPMMLPRVAGTGSSCLGASNRNRTRNYVYSKGNFPVRYEDFIYGLTSLGSYANSKKEKNEPV